MSSYIGGTNHCDEDESEITVSFDKFLEGIERDEKKRVLVESKTKDENPWRKFNKLHGDHWQNRTRLSVKR